MNYYEEIDPIGEEKANECAFCGVPCDNKYCSRGCQWADLE